MSNLPADKTLQALRSAVASHYSDRAFRRWAELAGDRDLDWPAVARLALVHGLGAMLYAAIAPVSGTAPPQVLSELKQGYQLAAAMNTLAMHDLRAILRALDEACVEVLLLKGAALMNDVYSSPALRPMIDIDLLIRFSDYPGAMKALSAIGYESAEPEPFQNLTGLYWNERLLHGVQGTRTQLELHWNLLDIPHYAAHLPVDDLMRRAAPLDADGVQALGLAPVDLLLHLCAHNLFHHQGLLWRTEVDVALVSERYWSAIDWDVLLAAAQDFDLTLAVRQTLSRAADYWFAPIPQPALERLDTLRPASGERAWVYCQRSEFLKLFRTLLTLPDLRHRVHFVQGQLFPSPDYLSWRYGVPASSPRLLAYATRYGSGVRGLLSELAGRNSESE